MYQFSMHLEFRRVFSRCVVVHRVALASNALDYLTVHTSVCTVHYTHAQRSIPLSASNSESHKFWHVRDQVGLFQDMCSIWPDSSADLWHHTAWSPFLQHICRAALPCSCQQMYHTSLSMAALRLASCRHLIMSDTPVSPTVCRACHATIRCSPLGMSPIELLGMQPESVVSLNDAVACHLRTVFKGRHPFLSTPSPQSSAEDGVGAVLWKLCTTPLTHSFTMLPPVLSRFHVCCSTEPAWITSMLLSDTLWNQKHSSARVLM